MISNGFSTEVFKIWASDTSTFQGIKDGEKKYNLSLIPLKVRKVFKYVIKC